MAKRNLKKEKAERNKLYGDKFRKEYGTRKRRSTAASWCRTPSHPYSCSCNLPSRQEVLALAHRK